MNADREPERRLRKLLQEEREYFPREERKGFVEHLQRGLAQSLSEDSAIGAAVDAGSLANRRASRGCTRVLDGDPEGFVEVDHYCLYKFWYLRIKEMFYDGDPMPDAEKRARPSSMDDIATCWMHAEAIGARSIRTRLDGLIKRVDAGYQGVRGKKMSALCTLMAHFVTGKDAATLEAEGWAPMDVYEPIAAGTFDASQWDTLANWHLENTSRNEFLPFYFGPIRVIPFELMAISRRTGIPISGSNPLLHTPLAVMREVPEIPVPEELQAVIDCAHRVYGDI